MDFSTTIYDSTQHDNFYPSASAGQGLSISELSNFVSQLLSTLEIDELSNLLEQKGVIANFVLVQHMPDSSFPNGIPNPLIVQNRFSTADAVKREMADFGVAFDGDFDRCFFYHWKQSFV
mgnify:CR=1 FL=1